MSFDDDTGTLEQRPPANPISHFEGHKITRDAKGVPTIEGPTTVGQAMQGRIPSKGDFDENLADLMGQGGRRQLAMRLCEFAKTDQDSRKDWAEREKRAREMLGIVDIAKPDDEQQGHNVTHPALMEATVRFQANAITELFPPGGPAETKVLGTQSPNKLQRATRIRTFVNHYLIEIDEGYFDDTDSMLMYLPMGGSVFRHASQDFTTGLPILRHVKATNFIAPYAGTDLKSMPRYARKFTMTGEDIDRAMEVKMFTDIHLPDPPMGQAQHAQSADASDLREPITHEKDRIYDMFEYHIDLELECDDMGRGKIGRNQMDTGLRPYIVVVDASSQETLMCRRNWKKNDSKRRKRIWFAHHKFLPGLGFYGWGYPHVIGSLGLAASGAVNALLDSALAANFQGGFVTKEGKVAGEYRLEHGVWKQVDSSAEDLAKSFYTPPFKEPSPALFQLLEILVEGAQRFAGTTDAAVGEGNNTGPVGTTVALIEQAQKPMSAIHKRLHSSMSAELQMLCELIEDFMPARYDYKIGDEAQFLLKQDFAPGVDVVCVTDPGVNSDTQRIMRAQAVMETQRLTPNLYPPAKQAAAQRRFFVALKVPNIDEIGPEVQQPKYLDAVSENGEIFAGRPVRVFPTQDDQAHLAIHHDAIARAQALFPPDVFEKVILPAMQVHIRDHMASSYVKAMMKGAGLPTTFDENGQPMGLSPQQEMQISQRVAQAIQQLPHPQPKPGTKSAEQQMSDAKVQAYIQQSQTELDQKEQAFQAEERRKQMAWENEERRKDQALAFEQGREDTATAVGIMRDGAVHQADRRQAETSHLQDIKHKHTDQGVDLLHKQQDHEVSLEQGDEQHKAGLDQGAEVHDQNLEQGDEAHKQTLKHGEESHAQELKQGDEAATSKIAQGERATKSKIKLGEKAGASKRRDGTKQTKAKIRQAAAEHRQRLQQQQEEHEQGLDQAAEGHEQQTDQAAETHEQTQEQSEEAHQQSLSQDAKAAAAEEAHADSHGGDGK